MRLSEGWGERGGMEELKVHMVTLEQCWKYFREFNIYFYRWRPMTTFKFTPESLVSSLKGVRYSPNVSEGTWSWLLQLSDAVCVQLWWRPSQLCTGTKAPLIELFPLFVQLLEDSGDTRGNPAELLKDELSRKWWQKLLFHTYFTPETGTDHWSEQRIKQWWPPGHIWLNSVMFLREEHLCTIISGLNPAA